MSRLSLGRLRKAAVLGTLVAGMVAGPALADNERFYAAAGARMSDGNNLHQEVPSQATGASAGVGNLTFQAGGLASVPVVGGQATASALVPAMRTDGLPYALDAGARSGVTYNFHVDGVNTGERVPVSIAGTASVSWLSGGSGEADVYLSGESGDTGLFRTWSALSTGAVSGGVINNIDEVLFLVPGVFYDVQLYAKADAETHYAGLDQHSSYAFAVADPVFTVVGDYADRYAIVGAPQPEAPVGGVPEPGVWALMLLGFGGLGARLRARRRRAWVAAWSGAQG